MSPERSAPMSPERTLKNIIADGILDRLVHNAHRIEMRGESMRKARNSPSGGER
jgi:DNA replication protein DnaC